MLTVISLCILALAVSLDGFGVGVMYGIRKIHISSGSILIISVCSGIIILSSMYLGVFLLQFLSPVFAKTAGASILISIGIWAIVQMRLQQNNNGQDPKYAATANSYNISQTFNCTSLPNSVSAIDILKSPSKADRDLSGNISSSEALLLGLALSLDAFGAGIGAALIGFSPIITAITISFASGTFISLGLRTGYFFSAVTWVKNFSVLPGLILILMGIYKLL